MITKINEAAEYIFSRINVAPEIAMITRNRPGKSHIKNRC